MKSSTGEWSDTENVSRSQTLSFGSRIAVDNNGNPHVVWEEYTENNEIHIYYSKRKNNIWSNPLKISGNSTSNDIPDIGIDDQGRVHVVWMGGALKYVRKDGDNWTQPIDITTLGPMNPAIYVEKEGKIHVVYEHWDHEIVYLYSPDAGSTWTEPMNISNSSYYSWTADVTADKDGKVYVVWSEKGGNGLWYAVKDTDGVWGNPQKIPGTTQYLWLPAIQINEKGEIFISYSGLVNEQWDIFYTKKDTTGNWSNSINISQTSQNSNGWSLGILPSGALSIVWVEELTQDNWEIYYDEVSP